MLWFIIGAVVGGAAVWFFRYEHLRNLNLTWYEWIIAALAVISLLLGIQNFDASMAGLEPGAAWTLFALFAFPAIFLALLDWRLIVRHHPQATVKS